MFWPKSSTYVPGRGSVTATGFRVRILRTGGCSGDESRAAAGMAVASSGGRHTGLAAAWSRASACGSLQPASSRVASYVSPSHTESKVTGPMAACQVLPAAPPEARARVASAGRLAATVLSCGGSAAGNRGDVWDAVLPAGWRMW